MKCHGQGRSSKNSAYIGLHEDPSEFDPRKYMKPAMAALMKLCRERFEQFGTAGHASEIEPPSVAEMAKRYKSGSLDPVFS